MPTEISMPRLGWDMKVGSVAEWLKKDGEHVDAGEPICTIGGDKATVELEAPESGILQLSPRSPGEGIEVPVGTVLAYLVAAGEAIPASELSTSAAERSTVGRRVIASPRARRAAAELGGDWRRLAGSGRGGRILERDVTGAGLQSQAHADAPQAPGVRLEFNGTRFRARRCRRPDLVFERARR